MKSLSDKICEHLKKLLEDKAVIKVQRSKLASKFDCAPSQINYVLNTRFTQEKGYIVESQRGGSGYLKIIEVELNSRDELINDLCDQIGKRINQRKGVNILERLYDIDLVSSFEFQLFKSLVDRQTLKLTPALRDRVRARLLKAILRSLLRKED